VTNLCQMGVQEQNLKFMVTGFESDKYITIKAAQTLKIIDVQNNFSMKSKKNIAEKALMNPSGPILAL